MILITSSFSSEEYWNHYEEQNWGGMLNNMIENGFVSTFRPKLFSGRGNFDRENWA